MRRLPSRLLLLGLTASAVAVSSLVPGTAGAQSVWTLDEIRAAARAEASAVVIAGADARIADADARSARAPLLPEVRLRVAGERHDREITIDLPDLPGAEFDPPLLQPRERVVAEASLSTALVDVDAWADGRAARLVASASDHRVVAEADAAELRAVELALRWVSLDATVDVLTELRDARIAQRDQVERRVRAGADTTLDLQRAEVDVRAAELGLHEAASTRDAVARALAAHLGDVHLDAVATQGLDAPPIPLDDPTATVSARADVAALVAQLDAAEEAAAAVTRSWIPDLVASAEAGWSSAEAVDGEHHRWVVRLAAVWIPFDRGLRQASATRAEARVARAEAALDARRIAAARSVADERAARQSATTALDLAQQRASLARDALTLAIAARDAGEATTLDVQLAQIDAAGAQQGVLDAELDAQLAAWRLWFALGRP